MTNEVDRLDKALSKAAKQITDRLVAAGAKEDAFPAQPKIARFIKVNGFWWVMQAVRITENRIRAGAEGSARPVVDPWEFVKAIVNGRPARAKYLYVLLHLWESSLRARIDMYFSLVRGELWYLDPSSYLSVGHTERLVDVQSNLFRPDSDCPELLIADTRRFPTARAFMRELYIDALHNILADNWDTFFRGRLPHPVRGPILATELKAWLRSAQDARNSVMHADIIENVLFRQSADALRPLLELLEFDVDKTLKGIDARDPHAEDFNLFE